MIKGDGDISKPGGCVDFWLNGGGFRV